MSDDGAQPDGAGETLWKAGYCRHAVTVMITAPDGHVIERALSIADATRLAEFLLLGAKGSEMLVSAPEVLRPVGGGT